MRGTGWEREKEKEIERERKREREREGKRERGECFLMNRWSHGLPTIVVLSESALG